MSVSVKHNDGSYRCTKFVFLPRCSESFESAILCPCEEYHIQRRGSPGLTEREEHFCKNKCEHRICAHSVIAHPLRVQPIFYSFVGDITSFAKNTPVIPQMLSSQLPTNCNAVTLYNTSILEILWQISWSSVQFDKDLEKFCHHPPSSIYKHLF